MNPRVSIMLTSYNHEPFLAEMIESILGQTMPDLELYILDDLSTDNSWEIIEKYAEQDSRIVARRAEKNGRHGRLRGLLPVFKGDYVAVAHSDDVWEPAKLEKQVAYLDSHPEVGGCFTRVKVIDDAGEVIPDHPCVKAFSADNKDRFEWLRYFFFNGNALCHPSALIRKASYDAYPLLVWGIGGLYDFRKWIQLCLHEEIHILDEPLIRFRVHGDGSNESAQTIEGERRVQIEWTLVLREYLHLDDRDEFLRVFPEAIEYDRNGTMCIPFALAQICLNNTAKEPHHLFGIQVIYDLFQDDYWREFLDAEYEYTDRRFTADKRRYDYLGNIGGSKATMAILYYDNGEGLGEASSIRQEKLVADSGQVKYEWDLSGLSGVRYVRFDPVDGAPCSCRVVSAMWSDGAAAKLTATNAFKDGDWDDFASPDPQYVVDLANKAERLEIVLEYRPWDLSKHLAQEKPKSLLGKFFGA